MEEVSYVGFKTHRVDFTQRDEAISRPVATKPLDGLWTVSCDAEESLRRRNALKLTCYALSSIFIGRIRPNVRAKCVFTDNILCRNNKCSKLVSLDGDVTQATCEEVGERTRRLCTNTSTY